MYEDAYLAETYEDRFLAERDYEEERFNQALMEEEDCTCEECPDCVRYAQANCIHSWVAGMMYVSEEDLGTIARERKRNGLSPIECEHCEAEYVAS